MYTPEEIVARLHERPFRPFRLVYFDGTAHTVVHPELVMVGRQTIVIGTPYRGRVEAFDKLFTLAYDHITAWEELAPEPTGAGQP